MPDSCSSCGEFDGPGAQQHLARGVRRHQLLACQHLHAGAAALAIGLALGQQARGLGARSTFRKIGAAQ